jgi:peroxiredoxin
VSLELHVLSQVTATREAVLDRLATRGWNATLSSGWPRWVALEHGPIAAQETILGWCSRWASAPDPQLPVDQLPISHYAGVGLTSRSPDPAWAQDLAREAPQLGDQLLAARYRYTVWTSAARTDLAYAFQHAVWRALGEATSGVLYDDTSGSIMSYALGLGLVPEVEAPPGPERLRGRIGAEAPDIELRAHDGTAFSLRGRRGSAITLWFHPHRSVAIDRQELEVLAKHQELIARRTNLIVIANYPSKDLAEHASRLGLRFPLLADDEHSVSRHYDADRARLTILIDENGIIRDRFERGELSRVVFDLLKRIGNPAPMR